MTHLKIFGTFTAPTTGQNFIFSVPGYGPKFYFWTFFSVTASRRVRPPSRGHGWCAYEYTRLFFTSFCVWPPGHGYCAYEHIRLLCFLLLFCIWLCCGFINFFCFCLGFALALYVAIAFVLLLFWFRTLLLLCLCVRFGFIFAHSLRPEKGPGISEPPRIREFGPGISLNNHIPGISA